MGGSVSGALLELVLVTVSGDVSSKEWVSTLDQRSGWVGKFSTLLIGAKGPPKKARISKKVRKRLGRSAADCVLAMETGTWPRLKHGDSWNSAAEARS